MAACCWRKPLSVAQSLLAVPATDSADDVIRSIGVVAITICAITNLSTP